MSGSSGFYDMLLWLLFQLWPLMFIAGLEGIIKGKKVKLLQVVRHMFFVWCGFAAIGIYLVISRQYGDSFLIPEPTNSIVFVGIGVLFGGSFFLLANKDRLRIKRELRRSSSLEELRKLSPADFEELVVEIFRQTGLKAKRVGEVGDHGIDVVIQSQKGKLWVAQCKRYRGKVGEPVIRDFYGAMMHMKAEKGFVITTGTFTKQACSWAEEKPIELWNGDKLFALIEELRQKETPIPVPESLPQRELNPAETEETPRCPDCGVEMVKRVAKRGKYAGMKFYGCPNYPTCKRVIKIE